MSEVLPLPEPLGGDRDRGSTIIIPQTIFLAIATCLVIARLITRGLITKSLGLDDLFIVLGNVSTINGLPQGPLSKLRSLLPSDICHRYLGFRRAICTFRIWETHLLLGVYSRLVDYYP